MIKATKLQKSYGNLQVLKGVDLEVSSGEVISIVGSSGAGKTTLLQILGTLDKIDNGQLFINGNDISKFNDRSISRFRNQTIGFVFQFHNLLNEFSALENICLPAFIAGTQKEKAEKKAKELIEILGLENKMKNMPNELSGGEQQRIAVARALINNPAVVLADEPSGNLDSKNAEELHHLFFKLNKEFGQTFILVTHNKSLADMADRKLLINDGFLSA